MANWDELALYYGLSAFPCIHVKAGVALHSVSDRRPAKVRPVASVGLRREPRRHAVKGGIRIEARHVPAMRRDGGR